MKNNLSKLLLVVLAVVFITGCTQQPASKLQQAKQMLDNKLITDSEYESI